MEKTGESVRAAPRELPDRPESTLAMAREPYDFIWKTCSRLRHDAFQTRLMLQKTICLSGPEAADLFYDERRFRRSGAAPGRLQKTLFGQGGVQGLDGEAHRHRKALFLSLVRPSRRWRLVDITRRHLHEYAARWTARREVILYPELREILCRAVCEWAGVPLPDDEVSRRTRELTALFQQAGDFGPKHWRARWERKKANRWAADLIQRIRRRQWQPPRDAAARVVAEHRDLKGQPLSDHDAAVELLNILRPTVAVSVYLLFLAVALHQHPEYQRRLQSADDTFAEALVQEVRRFYPFFPFATAVTRHDFEWHGFHFPAGRRALLDIYGTNHDPRAWEEPREFRPERFLEGDPGPYEFIPQGGGQADDGHRCPGEPIAVDLMVLMAQFLATHIRYEVPEQDLTIDRSKLPALPASRFVISSVRLAETAGGRSR